MRWGRCTMVGAMLLGTVAAGTSNVAEAATVPAGFTDVFVGSFDSPTAVEWMPGDRIVVLEKAGRVRVGTPGSSSFSTAIDLNVCSSGEQGLLGFTHDAGFATTRAVYIYYTAATASGCVNRVSRFAMGADGSIDPASETTLLDRISARGTNHNGGDLDIGSDGYLYVAVGDAGTDPRGDSGSAGGNDAAQDLSLLNGKILRITTDGAPAPGNPFTGAGTARCATRGNTSLTPTTTCQEIYAVGLRNPYRFAFDRDDGSGRFYINDVGQGTLEEVDEGMLGANYGWPSREGNCPQGQTAPCAGPATGLTDPITVYGRTTGRSITGGAFVPDGLWPSRYDGTYLFGDYVSGQIWLMEANGTVEYGSPFVTGASGMTDMTFGFDAAGRSALYYTTLGSVRAVVPPAPGDASTGPMKIAPTSPVRIYDTGNSTGGPAGRVTAMSTRVVDANPPGAYEAALVNLTVDATNGAGFLRAWPARTERPGTSSLNVDRTGATVANAAIVPLADDGTFIVESTTGARVVIDVLAWLDESGPTDDGRFIALDPARLADTREPSGQPLDSGSSNPWTDTAAGWDVDVAGQVGVPDDGTASAVVLSVVGISGPGDGGVLSVYPGGGDPIATSNVNVRGGEVRANLVVVPLGGDGDITIAQKNIANTVIDVAGYITSDVADTSGDGRYQAVQANRVVDTRSSSPFGTLQPESARGLSVPGAGSSSAVVQNLTLVNPAEAQHLSAHPSATTPDVSNLNVDGPGQIRAVLAVTKLGENGRMNYTAFRRTDLVVDVLGFFT